MNSILVFVSIIFGTVPKIRTNIKARLLMPSVSSISACGYIDFYWLGFRFDVNWFIFIFNIKSTLLWGVLVHQYHFHFFFWRQITICRVFTITVCSFGLNSSTLFGLVLLDTLKTDVLLSRVWLHMAKLLTFEILNLGTNNLVLYVLKPRNILFGKSGQLKYDLTVVVVAPVYPY